MCRIRQCAFIPASEVDPWLTLCCRVRNVYTKCGHGISLVRAVPAIRRRTF